MFLRSKTSRPSATSPSVIIIGAGIGGLTAGALLAHQGYQVRIYEQAFVPGGCASTFKRRGFTFDVGATQVAGLEPGGIHHKIFQTLNLDLPAASPCDPACAVYLPQESRPISVWQNAHKWQAERAAQFPGSDPFWQVLANLFQASWRFQARDPIFPPGNLWDLGTLVAAIRPDTLTTLPYLFSTVGDVLKAHNLYGDRRLKTFLDLQLKLYSQVDADHTAVLYAATALGISQMPFGLSHLDGSMQTLATQLVKAIKRDQGELYLRHRVEGIEIQHRQAQGVRVRNLKTGELTCDTADCVVANVTVQDLLALSGNAIVGRYKRKIETLPPSSGAFVIYMGVDQRAIPQTCPPHLQFLYDYNGPIGENNSLFVSVSRPGDGRAPEGFSTLIASSFTDPQRWTLTANYEGLKQDYTQQALERLGSFFDLRPAYVAHLEAATPRTFARFTARSQGIVGGVGQRLRTFGPFGFGTRTPIHNLWLVGDSTHPGEGTAGVSYSAWNAVRQIQKLIGSSA